MVGGHVSMSASVEEADDSFLACMRRARPLTLLFRGNRLCGFHNSLGELTQEPLIILYEVAYVIYAPLRHGQPF